MARRSSSSSSSKKTTASKTSSRNRRPSRRQRAQGMWQVNTVSPIGLTALGANRRQPGTITSADENAATIRHSKPGSSKVLNQMVHNSVIASMSGADGKADAGVIKRNDLPVQVESFLASEVTATEAGFLCTLEDGSEIQVPAEGTTVVMEEDGEGRKSSSSRRSRKSKEEDAGEEKPKRSRKKKEPEPEADYDGDEGEDGDYEGDEEPAEEEKPKRSRSSKASTSSRRKKKEPEPEADYDGDEGEDGDYEGEDDEGEDGHGDW